MQEKSHIKIVADNSKVEEKEISSKKAVSTNPIYGNFLAFQSKIKQKKNKMKDFFDGLF